MILVKHYNLVVVAFYFKFRRILERTLTNGFS